MAPNRSTQVAHAVVQRLLDHGVRHVVLSPGSRNAPLSLALARAEAAGLLSLHVRVDERSAGFLALGLGKTSGTAAVLVCTSGTAVANLLPAVVEACYAQVPLLLLTADRPPDALARGASQTIAQAGLFQDVSRGIWAFDDVADADDVVAGIDAAWRTAHRQHSGPVHVNIAFAEPLVPTAPEVVAGWPVAATPLGEADYEQPTGTSAATEAVDAHQRGVVVIGDLPVSCGQLRADAIAFARAAGWPVVMEPTASPRPADVAVRHHQLVTDDFLGEVSAVVSVGRFGLGRHLGRLVRSATTHIAVQPTPQPVDPYGTATRKVVQCPRAHGSADSDWLRRWQDADERARERVTLAMSTWAGRPTGLHTADAVLRAAAAHGASVFAAASRSIRDVDLIAAHDGPRIWANLGANGIDGLVSTARGIAADGPVFALLGDLAFLHDHNGLLSAPGESAPDITYVVADDDGGAIFSDLEQAEPHLTPWFERVFGTPHGRDLVAIASAAGISVRAVGSADALAASLTRPHGVTVVVVAAASRVESRDFRAALRG